MTRHEKDRSPAPARVVHLDDLPASAGPGTLTWRPARAELGVQAFGTNAYTATRVGDDLVEPHTEVSSGHEELYFVSCGCATFVLDGVEHDAPAGTYVFVPDPRIHRHAVAAEAETAVLSFGGPPTFTPSAWEWAFRADDLAHTDRDRARAVLEEGFGVHPGDPALLYGLACLEALDGNRDAALDTLERAVAAKPGLLDDAREDSDLESLRGSPRFAALLDTQYPAR